MKLELPERKFLVLILVALSIRLVLMFYSFNHGEDSFFLHDSHRYLGLGQNYFNEGFYAETMDQPIFESIFTPPGFPFFLYTFYSLGGPLLVVLIQIILQFISAFLIWKIISQFFSLSEKVKYGILFFFLLDIPTLVMGNLLMSETLFTTLLTAGIYFILKFYSKPNYSFLMYASFFWGLGCLVRPILFYFPLFFSILSLLFIIKEKRWVYLTLLLIPFYFITGIWSFCNYQKYDRWFFSYQGNFNIVYYQAATIYANNNNLLINEARNEIYEKGLAQTSLVNGVASPPEFYDNLLIIAFDIIKENPIPLLKHIAKAHINLFFRPVTDYLKIAMGSKLPFHSRGKYSNTFLEFATYYQIIINIITFLLLIIGLVTLFKIDVKIFYFMIIILIYFMIVCSGPEIEGRFRVPLVPLLIILAGAGLDYILKKYWKENKFHQ